MKLVFHVIFDLYYQNKSMRGRSKEEKKEKM